MRRTVWTIGAVIPKARAFTSGQRDLRLTTSEGMEFFAVDDRIPTPS